MKEKGHWLKSKARRRRWSSMRNKKWKSEKGYRLERGEKWAGKESLQKCLENIIEESPTSQKPLKNQSNPPHYCPLCSRNLFSFRISLPRMRKFWLMLWKKPSFQKGAKLSKKEKLVICSTLFSLGSTIVPKWLMGLKLSWRPMSAEIFLENWPFCIMPQELLPSSAEKLENCSLWIEWLLTWWWLELQTRKGSILQRP